MVWDLPGPAPRNSSQAAGKVRKLSVAWNSVLGLTPSRMIGFPVLWPHLRQLRWPRSVANCSHSPDVFQFATFARASKHQAAAAHVAATDEISRKDEAIGEAVEKWRHVLGCRDAAKKDE